MTAIYDAMLRHYNALEAQAEAGQAKPDPWPPLDYLAMADKAALALDWPAATALALIGILQQLKNVTMPGSQQVIHTFDHSRRP